MIKYVIISLLLTSCAVPRYTNVEPQRRGYKDKHVSDRIEECVFRLVEKSGIKAQEAQEACSKIHRKG